MKKSEIKGLKYSSDIKIDIKSFTKTAWGADPMVIKEINFEIKNDLFELKKYVEISAFEHNGLFDFSFEWGKGKVEQISLKNKAYIDYDIIKCMWDIAKENIAIFREKEVAEEIERQIDLQIQ
jgi:hypothetical protein